MIGWKKWLDKKQKRNKNTINKKDNKCFQFATAVELNLKEIKQHPEKIKKIKPFISKYNWDEINYTSVKIIGKNLRKII